MWWIQNRTTSFESDAEKSFRLLITISFLAWRRVRASVWNNIWCDLQDNQVRVYLAAFYSSRLCDVFIQTSKKSASSLRKWRTPSIFVNFEGLQAEVDHCGIWNNVALRSQWRYKPASIYMTVATATKLRLRVKCLDPMTSCLQKSEFVSLYTTQLIAQLLLRSGFVACF